MKRIAFILFAAFALVGCKPDGFTPKPRGYYQIDLPKHQYQSFDQPGFPFAFEYPTYGRVGKDSSLRDRHPDNPYWINVDFPEFGGRIYITYNRIEGQNSLAKLLEDAHFMSFYHSKRADYEEEQTFHNPYGVTGVAYEWGGNSASSYQFLATDTTTHFLRGALYFNATPNADSLRPVSQFLQKDIEHLLLTLRWK